MSSKKMTRFSLLCEYTLPCESCAATNPSLAARHLHGKAFVESDFHLPRTLELTPRIVGASLANTTHPINYLEQR